MYGTVEEASVLPAEGKAEVEINIDGTSIIAASIRHKLVFTKRIKLSPCLYYSLIPDDDMVSTILLCENRKTSIGSIIINTNDAAATPARAKPEAAI